jgi:hypothetical protein
MMRRTTLFFGRRRAAGMPFNPILEVGNRVGAESETNARSRRVTNPRPRC